MTQGEIEKLVAGFEHVTRAQNLGYMFFFVGDNQYVPFVSIATKDNEGDAVSNLKREGVFRINIGVSKKTFDSLFPSLEKEYDYSALDVFMPHPHYAKQFYICILNPSQENEAKVKEFIQEAYSLAKQREEIKKAHSG